MPLASDLEATEICSGSGLRDRCFFCDLSEESLRDFDTISLTGFYPQGAKLFAEGQQSIGFGR